MKTANPSSKTSTTTTNASSFKEHITRLKEEFDKKYNENPVSGASEKLSEYKFLAILGQGAFGLVVIYHSSFSLLPNLLLHHRHHHQTQQIFRYSRNLWNTRWRESFSLWKLSRRRKWWGVGKWRIQWMRSEFWPPSSFLSWSTWSFRLRTIAICTLACHSSTVASSSLI